MKRIVVTGATSMIGTALIEECIRHDIEVYAVVRAGSSKTKRLPESARIHQIECELEKLEELPAKITGECDTFFHGEIPGKIETAVQSCRAEMSFIL